MVLDAPATGHALAMLRSPRTFSAIARVGPIARQAQQVRDLLEDPERSPYLAVAHASEMAVTETLELRDGLRRDLGRELDAVVVNGALPRRFEGGELRAIAALEGSTGEQVGTTADEPLGARANGRKAMSPERGPQRIADRDAGGNAVRSSAIRAAHTVHRRARSQQSQIARLRRDVEQSDSSAILSVPFLFRAELDLEALERIADRLERGLKR